MGINRVDISENGKVRTLIDISDSTITQDAAVEGAVCYGPDGEKIIGSNPYKKTETDNEVQTQEDLIEEILQELEGKASNSGGIDTSDATATASDMAQGVTAYVNGEKVTGTLLVCEDGNQNKPVFREVYNSSESGEAIQFMLPWTKPETVDGVILKDGGVIIARIPKTEFGDATASDVVEGKTFTSENGYKAQGTLPEVKEQYQTFPADNFYMYANGTEVSVDLYAEHDSLIRKGAGLYVNIEGSNFGTATASDVLEGKTFTGADGFKRTGTMKVSSGDEGFQTKVGTTTSATIDTGLSTIGVFFIWRDGVDSTGLIHAFGDGNGEGTSTYCSAWSSNSWGSKTFATGTSTFTYNGGTVTWNGTGTQGLGSGKTYTWLAVGK